MGVRDKEVPLSLQVVWFGMGKTVDPGSEGQAGAVVWDVGASEWEPQAWLWEERRAGGEVWISVGSPLPGASRMRNGDRDLSNLGK